MWNQIIQPQIIFKSATQKLMMGKKTYSNLADEEDKVREDQEGEP